MTDPTPIAADPHVSGGVEDQYRAPSWERCVAFNDAAAECDRAATGSRFADDISADQRKGYAQACRLNSMALRAMASKAAPSIFAATLVPANAEGVREAVAGLTHVADALREVHALGRDGINDAAFDASMLGQIAACERASALLLSLTTRPTDTAEREAAVETATVERCAKVAEEEALKYQGTFSDGKHAANRIEEGIRALTPAHIADAGKGDTAARDEGMVLVPREPTHEMLAAAHDGPLMASDHPMDGKQVEWLKSMWSAMIAAAPETTHDR